MTCCSPTSQPKRPICPFHCFESATVCPREPAFIWSLSAKLITAPGARRLLALAEGGATVYASYFAGSTNSRRGPWITPLEEIFGVRHNLRYGLIDPILEDVVTFEFIEDLGDLKPGDVLSFKVGGTDAARAYLPVEPVDAKVVAVDRHGRPALLKHSIGGGSTVLSTYPIEHMAAHRALGESGGHLASLLGARVGVGSHETSARRGSESARRQHSLRLESDRSLCQLFERARHRRAIGNFVVQSAPVGHLGDDRTLWRVGGALGGLDQERYRAGRDFMRNTREQEEKEGGI